MRKLKFDTINVQPLISDFPKKNAVILWAQYYLGICLPETPLIHGEIRALEQRFQSKQHFQIEQRGRDPNRLKSTFS